jgi:hypothetical protein
MSPQITTGAQHLIIIFEHTLARDIQNATPLKQDHPTLPPHPPQNTRPRAQPVQLGQNGRHARAAPLESPQESADHR